MEKEDGGSPSPREIVVIGKGDVPARPTVIDGRYDRGFFFKAAGLLTLSVFCYSCAWSLFGMYFDVRGYSVLGGRATFGLSFLFFALGTRVLPIRQIAEGLDSFLGSAFTHGLSHWVNRLHVPLKLVSVAAVGGFLWYVDQSTTQKGDSDPTSVSSVPLPAPKPGEVRILVAEFASGLATKKPIAAAIVDQLKRNLAKYPDVTVFHWNRSIDPKTAGVTRFCRADGGTICIWGWHNEATVSASYELLPPPEMIAVAPISGVLPINLASLERFEVQAPIDKDLRYLALFSAGIARIAANDNTGALERLDEGIAIARSQAPSNQLAAMYSFSCFTKMRAGQVDGGVQDCTQSIETDRRNAIPYLNRAFGYALQRKWDQAHKDLELAQGIADSPGVRTIRAWIYNYQGRTDEAISMVRSAVARWPANPEPRLLLGAALSESGKFDEAIRILQELAPVIPKSFLRANEIGVAYFRENRLDEAIRHFRLALTLNPGFPPVRSNLAMALIAKGSESAARAEIDELIASHPAFYEAYATRARIRASNDLAGALEDADLAVKMRPNSAEAYSIRAHIQLVRKQDRQAIQDATRALELRPRNASDFLVRAAAYDLMNSPEKSRRDIEAAAKLRLTAAHFHEMVGLRLAAVNEARALEHFTKATALDKTLALSYSGRAQIIAKKDIIAAIGTLDEGIAHRPMPSLFSQRAFLECRVSRLDAAEKDFAAALLLEPNFVPGLLGRATCRGPVFSERNEADIRQAIRIRPEFAPSHLALARLLRTKGDFQGAVEAAEQATKLDSNSIEAHYTACSIWGGDIHLNDKAIPHCERLVSLAPKEVMFQVFLGGMYTEAGKLKEAGELLRRTAILAPSSPEMLNNRANLELALGNIGRAEKDCKKAVELRPSHASLQDTCGLVYTAKGDLRLALVYFDRAISLAPTPVHFLNRGRARAASRMKLEAEADFKRAIAGGHEAIKQAARTEIARLKSPV